jgi:hypothetical protein
MKHTPHIGRLLWISVAAFLLTPAYAAANIGIPMLGYAWPLAWALLIPVIVLEAFVARYVLRTNWLSSLKIAGLSNLISTLAGIPLAWGAIVLLGTAVHTVASVLPRDLQVWVEMPFYAAWLPPFADMPQWLVPAAGALLCLPFFFASVWVERKVAQRFSAFQRTDLQRWAWRANLLTYSLVAAGLAIAALLVWLGQ